VKVIRTDNLDRDHVSDELVCSGIHAVIGKFVVDALNERYRDRDYWYRLVPDDHKLYVFEP
jgi:hypothetical protein